MLSQWSWRGVVYSPTATTLHSDGMEVEPCVDAAEALVALHLGHGAGAAGAALPTDSDDEEAAGAAPVVRSWSHNGGGCTLCERGDDDYASVIADLLNDDATWEDRKADALLNGDTCLQTDMSMGMGALVSLFEDKIDELMESQQPGDILDAEAAWSKVRACLPCTPPCVTRTHDHTSTCYW
jgi:hypothetical protein